MRAQIFGGLTVGPPGHVVQVPAGHVGTLLRWLLLRPDEAQAPAALVELLWGARGESGTDAADGAVTQPERTRLYGVVRRLRTFLASTEDAAGLRLVTDGAGYRLVTDEASLDRVSFEAAARRALGTADDEAIEAALALWGGDPYAGFPPWAEVQRQRARLVSIHRRLLRRRADRQGEASGRVFPSTKFTPPEISSRSLLRRAQLVERMGRPGDARVVVVAAPAGFGKSVLAAQWLQDQCGLGGWVHLDEADNDPVVFWSAVHEALAASGAVDPAATDTHAAPGSARSLVALARRLEAAEWPIGLVLDDAHVLDNPDLWEQLSSVVGRLPRGFTVVLTLRPPAPHTPDQWTARTDVRAVGPADLRFGRQEVAALTGHGPHDGQTRRLMEATEGWPIGVWFLHRAGVSVDELAAGPPAVLHDYVIEEVYRSLPDDVQSFLLHTAHLERLSPELCAATAGTSDAERHLAWLRDHGMFLTELASEVGWLRYHPIVGQALRRLAGGDPAVDATAAHRRAARWYADEGMPALALDHALRGEDHDLAASLAGEVVWGAAERNEIHSCRRWLHRLDPDMLTVNRPAHDVAALAAAGWLEPDRLEAWTASRRRAFGTGDLLVSMAEGHTAYLQGRPDECIVINRQCVGQVDAYFTAHPNRPEIRDIAMGVLSTSTISARILLGEVGADDPELRELAQQSRTQMPLMRLWVLGEWSFVAYLDGDRQLAAELVAEAEPYLASMDELSIQLGAARLLVTRSLLASETASHREAQVRVLRRLEAMVGRFRELRWDVELVPVLLAMHVAAHRTGELDLAASRLEDADVLLSLCGDVPLLWAARERLDMGIAAAGTRGVSPLTPRERQVLEHLATARSYAQIADQLEVSVHTVTSHVRSIYRKLGVRSRHGAVRRGRLLSASR